ncbi:MAG: hypothetical protein KatS3mg073_0545 [Meiothermus sp.]|uniref:Lysine transporter LysE n=1 Tax=Meiothermus hypogaeus TaxID=884155 RepID=A0ABX9MQY8_9DEIN|nr:hypothetical protein Mhypo_00406 [Meiothermus hypogaeus]GIW36400.1 MAG: hypothetical protein KatS3mg073_0545 [Meiothermus sp.]
MGALFFAPMGAGPLNIVLFTDVAACENENGWLEI